MYLSVFSQSACDFSKKTGRSDLESWNEFCAFCYPPTSCVDWVYCRRMVKVCTLKAHVHALKHNTFRLPLRMGVYEDHFTVDPQNVTAFVGTTNVRLHFVYPDQGFGAYPYWQVYGLESKDWHAISSNGSFS